MRAFLFFVATSLASVAFQILLATGHFKQYEWAAPYMFGLSGLAFLIWIATIPRVRARLSPVSGQAGMDQLSPHATLRDSGNATISDSANIRNSGNLSQTTHIHLPSTFVAAAPVAQPKREPWPRLDLLEIRSAVINKTGGIRYEWVEVQHDGYPASIMVFRNRHAEVGDEAAGANSVVARLIYTPKHAKRVEINAGCWLNTAPQYVSLSPGEVAKLIVAVQLERDQGPFALYNPRDAFPIYVSQRARMREQVVNIEPHQIAAIPCEVEVVLVAENRTLFRGCFELCQAPGGAMYLEARA